MVNGQCEDGRVQKEFISKNYKRDTLSSPTLELNTDIDDIYDFRFEDIKIIGYDAHPNIKVDVAV